MSTDERSLIERVEALESELRDARQRIESLENLVRYIEDSSGCDVCGGTGTDPATGAVCDKCDGI